MKLSVDQVLDSLRRGGDGRLAVLASLEGGEAVCGDGVVRTLVELLAEPCKEVRRRAAGALGRAAEREEFRDQVRRALHDGDGTRRWGAAFALARAGLVTDGVLAEAIAALGDRDGDVRWAAAEIVRANGSDRPDVTTSLWNATANGANAETRKMAFYCLRDLGLARAEPCMDGLLDPDPNVRLAALSAVSTCPDPGPSLCRRVIAMLCDDEVIGVRRAAAITLGRIGRGDPSVRAALERTVASAPDTKTVQAASIALSTLGAV